MFASVFVLGACSAAIQTPFASPAVSPSASPLASASPGASSPVSTQTPSGSSNVSDTVETSSTPLPVNPVRLFSLLYTSDTEANRAAFEHALSKGGIDELNTLMELCEMDAYLSKAPLSVGSLLFDANAYAGDLSVPQGTGSLDPESGEFTFSYAGGNVLYGLLEENRMGCYALDSAGNFMYMVRMEKTQSGWLACVDTARKRILAQWDDTSRFLSFSNAFEPYLPKINSGGDSSWGTPAPVMSFAVENWYDFSWDTLSYGAVSVFSVTGGTLAVSSAP